MIPENIPPSQESAAAPRDGKPPVRVASILWRHLAASGRDACDLWRHDHGWSVTGTSIFREGETSAHLRYAVDCDAGWLTRKGRVSGTFGERSVEIEVAADAKRHWSINGLAAPPVDDCADLDLNFTPATNLIQLRRIALTVGQRAQVPAAWLDVAEHSLQPLAQTYRRVSVPCYEYAAPSVGYSGLLQVHELGFVLEYPGQWTAEVLQVWEK